MKIANIEKKSRRSMRMLALMLAPEMILLSSLWGQRSAWSLDFNTPGADVGQPGTSIGGGTRGIFCSVPEDYLQALVPSQNAGAVGRTVSKAPTLYWYIPEMREKDGYGNPTKQPKRGEVAIVDEEENEVYVAEFTLPVSPGIIKYEIPASAGLEEGKRYKWIMSIVCNPQDRSQDEFVGGNLLVVEEPPGLQEDLAVARTALNKASVYAKAQIWHDTVSSLAEAAEEHPEEWAQLLASVGLSDKVAAAKVVDCCSVEN